MLIALRVLSSMRKLIPLVIGKLYLPDRVQCDITFSILASCNRVWIGNTVREMQDICFEKPNCTRHNNISQVKACRQIKECSKNWK